MSAHWRSLAGDAGKTKERTSESEGTAAVPIPKNDEIELRDREKCWQASGPFRKTAASAFFFFFELRLRLRSA